MFKHEGAVDGFPRQVVMDWPFFLLHVRLAASSHNRTRLHLSNS